MCVVFSCTKDRRMSRLINLTEDLLLGLSVRQKDRLYSKRCQNVTLQPDHQKNSVRRSKTESFCHSQIPPSQNCRLSLRLYYRQIL